MRVNAIAEIVRKRGSITKQSNICSNYQIEIPEPLASDQITFKRKNNETYDFNIITCYVI